MLEASYLPRTHRPILICDRDSAFLERLQLQSGASNTPVIFESHSNTALELLQSSDRMFGAIVINANISEPVGVHLLRAAVEFHPETPILYVFDEQAPLSSREKLARELEKLPVRKILNKPFSLDVVIESAVTVSGLIDSTASGPDRSGSPTRVGETATAAESDFVPVYAANFLGGVRSIFEVYVRLGGDGNARFVKILDANDAFSEDRIQLYVNKGVQYFYLKKTAHLDYLKYCDQVAQSLLQSPIASDFAKLTHTLNQGQEVAAYLRAVGINAESVAFAEKYVENVRTLIHQIDRGNGGKLAQYLLDIVAYEHGVATAMVASLLGRKLGFEEKKSAQIIGLASILHDIGFQRVQASPELRKKFDEEDLSNLTAAEFELYKSHVQHAVDMLGGVPGIDPTVVQAVAQHHERRGRNGFPNRLGPGQINRVAEIIGISEEFVRLVRRSSRDRATDPIRDIKATSFDGFSNEITRAFSEALGLTP